MAKVRKARLKVGTEVIAENDEFPRGKKITLNIDGAIADPNNAARTARVFVRLFYRVNGIPFALNLHQNDSPPIPAGTTSFSLATDFIYTPRRAATYSACVVAWDKGANANQMQASIKTHVVRFRAK